MVYWLIGLLVILVALLIPILAIVLDSPALHKLVEARGSGAGEAEGLSHRVEVLEDEVDELTAALGQLREETQFLQRLLEDSQDDRPQLPPSQS